jgi:hypothetical protein
LTPATEVEKAESEPHFGVNIGDYSGRLQLLSGASFFKNLRKSVKSADNWFWLRPKAALGRQGKQSRPVRSQDSRNPA